MKKKNTELKIRELLKKEKFIQVNIYKRRKITYQNQNVNGEICNRDINTIISTKQSKKITEFYLNEMKIKRSLSQAEKIIFFKRSENIFS